jgi:arsenite-transporting ATPase
MEMGLKIKNTPYLFFTGKGGVGKTSLACASAIQLADEGKKVLLISTDPASNLEDVLQCKVGSEVAAVEGVKYLFAVNINPDAAAAEYRNRVLQPLKDRIDPQEWKKTEEGLSGACTTEIASFDAFSRFMDEAEFEVLIFDTAPTGHTLRLLELPAAWADFAGKNPAGASCLGPSTALNASRMRYSRVVEMLRNPAQTTFMLVSRAEAHSLKEASRTSEELHALGMHQQVLLLNGIFRAPDSSDPVASGWESRMKKAIQTMPDNLQKLSRSEFPLLPYNVLGRDKLRSLFHPEIRRELLSKVNPSLNGNSQHMHGLTDLLDEICADGKRNGLIMTMGKGGVGKTLTASALAVMLAERGMEVLLTTTDPAAHVQDFMSQLKQIPPGLEVERINPKEEKQRYIEQVMSQKGKNLNEQERALLLEDLQSPCNEEVAVFHAFSKAIRMARRKFVVMDTAPTGHTLLLLDITGSYHREVIRNMRMESGKVHTPLMWLQDKELSKILLVSLPETTPMREAAALQEDLRRAGVEPYAWVINQSLLMVPGLADPLLRSRAQAESAIFGEIRQRHSAKTFGIPFLPADALLPALLDELGIPGGINATV